MSFQGEDRTAVSTKRAAALAFLRSELAGAADRAPQSIHQNDFFRPVMRPMYSGWLLPILVRIDDLLWGRWEHWTNTILNGAMLNDPIPQVEWCHVTESSRTRSHVEHCLNLVTRHGGWQGWSSWNYMEYFLDWLLYGFGHHKEEPKEPAGCEGAAKRLYQVFCLERLMAYPYDYIGDIMAENRHGQHIGFYPTPMCVCEMMVRMQMHDEPDMRDKTVLDPCVGTGRMLLCASNMSYRLHGMDKNPSVIKATLINGYMYAPWLVKPFPFWEGAAQGQFIQQSFNL